MVRFAEKAEWEKRYFIPRSAWPLLAWQLFDDNYEEGLRKQKDLTDPEIVVYRPDEQDDQKPYTYNEILALVDDGVLDNLVHNDGGAIGVSDNDLRALGAFVEKSRDAWIERVSRLEIID
ncbi:hypothetical protein [Methylocella silvestris]|uniref:Uncharacterized protein n=1 Tax=Methylocella silvestris TaxID=199596 RepID=A0A2J7TJY6_METSI|nr:hypothetical protein [Methylocella silvestris]PNG27074.1 hypothetical protein CR492_05105 [Methylocella silvestris]